MTIQPLNGLGESACERLARENGEDEVMETTTAELPLIERVSTSLRNTPEWVPWAIAAGSLTMLIAKRRK